MNHKFMISNLCVLEGAQTHTRARRQVKNRSWDILINPFVNN